MRLAFRKIKGKWNPISRIIGWVTKSKYCHVEGVFSNGMWYGAVLKGLRFTDEISGNPDKWDFVALPISIATEDRLYDLCKLLEGRKYDIAGLFEFVTFGAIQQDPRASYCSEVWRWLLSFRQIKVLPEWRGKKCSPQNLYEALQSWRR